METNSFTILKSAIESENINSWFEMDLFLDKIRDTRKPITLPDNFDTFVKSLSKGIAFITFDYGVDGVTIEIEKYTRIFQNLVKNHANESPNIFYIGDSCNIDLSQKEKVNFHELSGSIGFDYWDGYKEFFFTDLSRGGEKYNKLFKKIWDQTVSTSLELGKFIQDNDIRLLVPVNINSNPGNVALAFSIVLISEFMKIPVLNSNHDFYWEDGIPKTKRKQNQSPGLRDHFFTNAGIGEVFSLIEMLYPWDSPGWFQCTINETQSKTLIEKFGFNPLNVGQIPTFIDTEKYSPKSHKMKKNILKRLQTLFTGSEKKLYSKSILDVIEEFKNPIEFNTPYILGNKSKINIHLDHSNILILQPTRIIRRKRIERTFEFLGTLLKNPQFHKFFITHSQLTITILISGPVATGQGDYYKELVHSFNDFLNNISEKFQNRIFIAFKFGFEINEYMKRNNIKSIDINELFGTATMVTLPSETEGRGLPIIESSSSGVPLIVNRYKPEQVYSDIIGENLDNSLRLKVFEFPKDPEIIPDGFLDLFTDHESYVNRKEHNRNVIEKRFSIKVLQKKMENFLHILWSRSQHPNMQDFQNVKEIYKSHNKITKYNKQFNDLVLCDNRKYIPGYTDLEFMIILKSLIDPSYFRMEEKELRGRVMRFAYKIFNRHEKYEKIDKEKKYSYYNQIEALFEYNEGIDDIVIDHSLSYRHRHNLHYNFRKITEFELKGLITEIFRNIIGEIKTKQLPAMSFDLFMKSHFSLSELVENRPLKINDKKRLEKDFHSNKSIAIFHGSHLSLEIRILVINTLKYRFGIKRDKELTQEIINNFDINKIGKIYLFIRKKSIGSPVYFEKVKQWVHNTDDNELKLLYNAGLFQLIPTEVITPGTHLGQLGSVALKTLLKIKNDNGFLIALGDTNYMMIDKIDIPSYRIGTVKHVLFRNYSQIRRTESYIQWVPAGLSPCLAYPTPIQTPIKFTKILKCSLYKKCCKEFGEDEVLKTLREDANLYNSPIKSVLEGMIQSVDNNSQEISETFIKAKMLTGIHDDGQPWSGARLNVNSPEAKKNKYNIQFHTMFSSKINDTVLDLVNKYEKQNKKQVYFAWNGGYMLNPELVGKLGLPEEYIGSPLGLVIINGVIKSLPLYNKPALYIDENNQPAIRHANIENGVTISVKGGDFLKFSAEQRNIELPKGPGFYDLLYPQSQIYSKGRTIYRFAGNKIIDIITNTKKIDILPVGITVSTADNLSLKGWEIGTEVDFQLNEWSNIRHAIEAGPMTVEDGKIAINMEKEGWKTDFSIATQAARVDYTHLRGPKIGVGLLESGELITVAINGRIRESVGATHIELAKILIEQGAKTGMGFDPGGSVTLIHKGKQLNISPYNINYETNPYSLPPQARRIGNAILGTIDPME